MVIVTRAGAAPSLNAVNTTRPYGYGTRGPGSRLATRKGSTGWHFRQTAASSLVAAPTGRFGSGPCERSLTRRFRREPNSQRLGLTGDNWDWRTRNVRRSPAGSVSACQECARGSGSSCSYGQPWPARSGSSGASGARGPNQLSKPTVIALVEFRRVQLAETGAADAWPRTSLNAPNETGTETSRPRSCSRQHDLGG